MYNIIEMEIRRYTSRGTNEKVIAFLTIATITTITGCSKVEVSTNIEDFYLQSIIEQTEDISLEDAKKALANFEYEYELQEYSKDLSE